MAAIQTLCSVFKQNILVGAENFTPGGQILVSGTPTAVTYKIALYTALANIDATTVAYTAVNEITGVGYTAGGEVLTPIAPGLSGTTAFVSFNNVTWSPASFTANSALIYNATTNAAVCVLNFGSDKTATNSFTITFPVNDASTAVIRIA